MKRIFVEDRTGARHLPPDTEWFRDRVEPTPPCNGLAILARRHCANFGSVCKNCRLCTHRRQRCGYFERAVLPGLSIKDAERYASQLDVALEKHRRSYRRVASWDLLPAVDEIEHAA